MGEIYLDNNASTQPTPAVIDAVTSSLASCYANPSSPHSAGVRSRQLVESARDKIALLCGVKPNEVHFTSGGTEANNLALSQCLRTPGALVISSVEHSSIQKYADWLASAGIPVERLAVRSDGVVDLDVVENRLKSGNVALVSIQWVNSETGVIQPVEEIANLCREYGVPFHTDAVQALGKLDVRLADIGVDFASLSAHKMHGTKGIGALIVRDGLSLSPQIHGGSQERGLRAGTENVPGIAGFAKAASDRRARLNESIAQLSELRDRFEGDLLDVEGVHLNGAQAPRICNTSNLRFDGVDGAALLASLQHNGLQASQSSACVSARPEPSFVLTAMGLSEVEAYSSIRFSFSVLSTKEEAEEAAKIVKINYGSLRDKMGTLRRRETA